LVSNKNRQPVVAFPFYIRFRDQKYWNQFGEEVDMNVQDYISAKERLRQLKAEKNLNGIIRQFLTFLKIPSAKIDSKSSEKLSKGESSSC